MSAAVEALEAGQQALEAEAAALRAGAGGAAGSPLTVASSSTEVVAAAQPHQQPEQQGTSSATEARLLKKCVWLAVVFACLAERDVPPNHTPNVHRLLRIRAYRRLVREQGQQIARLGEEKADAQRQVHEAHAGWQAWRAERQDGELAAERRAMEAEVKARLQEEWAAQGEARARREGKEVGWWAAWMHHA